MSLTVLLSVGALIASYFESDALSTKLTDARFTGSHYIEVIARDASVIPAATCEHLNHVSGISAAGGIISNTYVYPINQPGSDYPVFAITETFPVLAWANPGTEAVHVGNQLQQTLGLVEGGTVSYIPANAEDAGAEPSPTLLSVPATSPERDYRARLELFEAAFGIVEPATGNLDTCYFETAELLTDEVAEVVTAAFYPNQVELARNIQAQNHYLATESDFVNRTTRHLSLAVSGLLAAYYLFTVYTRRTDFALYRSFGARPGQIFALLVPEFLLSYILPISAVFSIGIFILQPGLDSLVSSVVFADYLRQLSILAIAPLLAWLMIIRQNIFNTLKGD